MRDLGDERVSRNFAGSLLVAHPNMVDQNFRRTVLFVSEHEPEEGALDPRTAPLNTMARGRTYSQALTLSRILRKS